MKKKIVHIFLAVLLLAGWSNIAAAEEVKTLTLDQAIDIALKANPQLKQVANQVTLGQVSVKQKKTNFYPDLSLSANASQQYGKTFNQETGTYESSGTGNLGMSLSSNTNLFNGFYDTASLQQSKFELKAAEENLSRSRQSIIFETLQRYIQVVTAGELIKVEEENLEAQRLQLERIEDFYKAGRRPITDLYQQKADISRSEYRLLDSQRQYEVNKLLLMQTLGLEPHADYQVANPGVEDLLKDVKEFNKTYILEESRIKRSDLKAREKQVEAAQAEIKTSRAGYWPKLSLFADLGSNYTSANDWDNFSTQFFDNNLNATVGLSLSIPLFDRGVTKQRTAAAKINLENTQLELKKLEDQVSVEVQQAIADYSTAEKQTQVTESQLNHSRSALESMEERYNVNAAAMVELTQARSQYVQSQYDRVTAMFNQLIRGIAVAFYIGDTEAMIVMLKG